MCSVRTVRPTCCKLCFPGMCSIGNSVIQRLFCDIIVVATIVAVCCHYCVGSQRSWPVERWHRCFSCRRRAPQYCHRSSSASRRGRDNISHHLLYCLHRFRCTLHLVLKQRSTTSTQPCSGQQSPTVHEVLPQRASPAPQYSPRNLITCCGTLEEEEKDCRGSCALQRFLRIAEVLVHCRGSCILTCSGLDIIVHTEAQ